MGKYGNFFDPDRLPPLREVISHFQLSARHSLGQHFILDPNLIRKIVRGAGNLSGKTVIEVGPGPGGLTRGLLEVADTVTAIETDRRCLEPLSQLVEASEGRLRLLEKDATKISPSEILRPGESATIVSNLPYNIGTHLLIIWLKDLPCIESMTLMFQKEVAERITALPGDRSYGRLSVITQWLCETQKLFDVPAKAFKPSPKVTSTVISLHRKPAPLYPAKFNDLEAVTRAAFGQRRKMLRSSLKSILPNPSDTLKKLRIAPTERAENLSIFQFCILAQEYNLLLERSSQ